MLTNRVLSRVILSPLSTSVAYSQRLPTSIDNENRRLQINNEKTTLSLSQSRRGYNNCTSSRNVCLKGLSRLPHRDVLSHSLEPFLDCQENVIYIPARLKSKDKGKGGKGKHYPFYSDWYWRDSRWHLTRDLWALEYDFFFKEGKVEVGFDSTIPLPKLSTTNSFKRK